jgi:hypothetical protein
MPRRLRPTASWLRFVAPAARRSAMMGRRSLARSRAISEHLARPLARPSSTFLRLLGVPSLFPRGTVNLGRGLVGKAGTGRWPA